MTRRKVSKQQARVRRGPTRRGASRGTWVPVVGLVGVLIVAAIVAAVVGRGNGEDAPGLPRGDLVVGRGDLIPDHAGEPAHAAGGVRGVVLDVAGGGVISPVWGATPVVIRVSQLHKSAANRRIRSWR